MKGNLYSYLIKSYGMAVKGGTVDAENLLNTYNITDRQKEIIRLNYDRPALICNDVFDLEIEFNEIEGGKIKCRKEE